MFCTNCGASNADGAKFCVACGTPLVNNQPETPATPVAPVYAPPVYETPEDATTVYAPPVQSAPQTPVYEEPVQQAPVYEAPVQQPQYYAPVTPDMQPMNQPEPPKKKDKTGLIIGIVVGVLVLIGAVVAILFATGVFDSDSEKDDIKTEQTDKKKEEEKEEKDPLEIAKENLEGEWTLRFESYEDIGYGITVFDLPYTVVLEDDGTYYVTEDQAQFDDMIYLMIDAILEGEGYFALTDEEKEYFFIGMGVADEEELYSALYDVMTEDMTVESFKESMFYDCPFEDSGYWATDGEYLFFTYSEDEAKDFPKNSSEYIAPGCVISVDSSTEVDEFACEIADGTLYFNAAH